MADPTYPLFPIFSFLGFVLLLIPLPWHWEAMNSGTCFFIFWASLACLNQFINSVIWAGNALNLAPWWCEISIRIMFGACVGIPAASLCIVRRLYNIANVHAASITLAEKRRAVLIDALICILFPVIYIALQYVVQGHRFNIVEDIGCYPAIFNTPLAYFTSAIWPIVIGLISTVYCVLTLHSFSKRRAAFGQFLASNTSLTLGRYFRLMALAMTEIGMTTPLAIFSIYLNATTMPIEPWVSWDETHYGYSRVDIIPSIVWRANKQLATAFEFTRWMNPICAIIFFAFFGFAVEARRNYQRVFIAIRNKIVPAKPDSKGGLTTGEKANGKDVTAILPRHFPRPLVLGTFRVLPSATSSMDLSRTATMTTTTTTTKGTMSPLSRLSTSTVTLATYSPRGCSLSSPKEEEPKDATLPTYYAARSPSPYDPSLLDRRIDPRQHTYSTSHGHDLRESMHLPGIDNSDTFTVDTFSYYEGRTPATSEYASSSSASTTAPQTPTTPTTFQFSATSTFVEPMTPTTPHSPPRPPPSPRYLVPQHSLPPPPRRTGHARAAGSLSSLMSGSSARTVSSSTASTSSSSSSSSYSASSASTAQASDHPTTIHGHAPADVPEDVGPVSYTQPVGVLATLPERAELDVHTAGPLQQQQQQHLQRQRVLGVAGGAVQRQASVDRRSI